MGGWGYREGRQARVTGKVEREVGQRKERKESKEGEEERGRGKAGRWGYKINQEGIQCTKLFTTFFNFTFLGVHVFCRFVY